MTRPTPPSPAATGAALADGLLRTLFGEPAPAKAKAATPPDVERRALCLALAASTLPTRDTGTPYDLLVAADYLDRGVTSPEPCNCAAKDDWLLRPVPDADAAEEARP